MCQQWPAQIHVQKLLISLVKAFDRTCLTAVRENSGLREASCLSRYVLLTAFFVLFHNTVELNYREGVVYITQKKARSAKTGRFVEEWVAKKYPDTTYIDTIKYPNAKKRG